MEMPGYQAASTEQNINVDELSAELENIESDFKVMDKEESETKFNRLSLAQDLDKIKSVASILKDKYPSRMERYDFLISRSKELLQNLSDSPESGQEGQVAYLRFRLCKYYLTILQEDKKKNVYENLTNSKELGELENSLSLLIEKLQKAASEYIKQRGVIVDIPFENT